MTTKIPIKAVLDIQLSPAQVRRAAGPTMMQAARALILEERRLELAHEARRSNIAAHMTAVRTVVDAFTRYEASVGTRDEKRALAHLAAACAGLRTSLKAIDSLTNPKKEK